MAAGAARRAGDPAACSSGQLGYWREALAGAPPELELPTDRPRPAVPEPPRAARSARRSRPRLHAGLAELARQQGVTLFMVLHAALAVLLARLGAGTDIPVGTAIAGRTDEALDDLVGFFVNTLVLRTDMSATRRSPSCWAGSAEPRWARYEHQDVPFEQLVEVLNPARSLARHPLFQVMLTLQNGTPAAAGLPGDEPPPSDVTGPHKFDLDIALAETRDADAAGRAARAVLDSGDLFGEETARAVTGRLRRVLAAVAADPRPGCGRSLLTAAERPR